MVTERGSAVGAGDREGVGVGGAVLELVVLGVRGVGPGAGAIDGEGAVAADGAGLRHEARRAVDVADGERAGGGKGHVGLAQIADVGGEHRCGLRETSCSRSHLHQNARVHLRSVGCRPTGQSL